MFPVTLFYQPVYHISANYFVDKRATLQRRCLLLQLNCRATMVRYFCGFLTAILFGQLTASRNCHNLLIGWAVILYWQIRRFGGLVSCWLCFGTAIEKVRWWFDDCRSTRSLLFPLTISPNTFLDPIRVCFALNVTSHQSAMMQLRPVRVATVSREDRMHGSR